MERRDFIQEEIEKIGIFLKRTLSKLMNIKTETSSDDFESIENEFINNIDFDLKYFTTLKETEVENYLSSFKFSEESLEKIALIFIELSKSNSITNSDKIARLSKAIEILNYADKLNSSFSIERNQQKNYIFELIQNIEVE
ncbi:MAG: hypothetical protein R2790_08075 [Flavobacterium haoranii]